MIKKYLTPVLFAAFSAIAIDCSKQPEPISWRALPVLSSQLQTSIGPVARFFDKFTIFGARKNEHMPLYECGAPNKIYVVECHNSEVIIAEIVFIRPGAFYKAGPWRISSMVDSQLMDLIRKTTAIEEPYGHIYSSQKDHDTFGSYGLINFYKSMLCAQAIFSYHSPSSKLPYIQQALEHPFVFVASNVSDEMLIQAIQNISWNNVFEKLGKNDADGIIEYDGDEIECYRKAFNTWHISAHKALHTARALNQKQLILCIE